MYYSEPIFFVFVFYTFIIYISEANLLTKIDLMKKISHVLTYVIELLMYSS